MTAQYRLDQGLREFLREQESEPAYLAEVFAATSRTRQRGPSLADRLSRVVTGGLPVADGRAMRITLIGLLLAAVVGVALVVGALLRHEDDPDAFVLAAYQQVARGLPPMRLVIREEMEGVLDLVIFYDGDRRVREEYGDSTSITGTEFTAQRQPDVPGEAWVVTERRRGPIVESIEQIVRAIGMGPTNCVTGWESFGTEILIGRTTRHLRCTKETSSGATTENHLWIDLETGLPLKTASPLGNTLVYVYVAELEIGPQAESLFALDGETVSAFEHECAENGGICPSRDPSQPAPSTAPPAAGPVVTPPPAPGPQVAPADVDRFVADAQAAYEEPTPLEIRFDRGTAVTFSPGEETGWHRDGLGNYRAGGWLMVGGRVYEADSRDGKPWRAWSTWRTWSTRDAGALFAPTFDLPSGCGIGWKYLGDDLVLHRPAAHLVCGLQEFWIDREWLLVTRAHDHDVFFGDDPAAGLSEVVSVTFGPQPAQLFAEPSQDEVWR